MRCQSAHGMEGHGIAGNGVVLDAPGIGPGNWQFNALVACRDAHFARQAVDGGGGNAGYAFRPFRRVLLDAFLQQLERRFDGCTVLELEFAPQKWVGAPSVRDDRLVGGAVPPQFILRVVTGLLFRNLGAQEHAELIAVSGDIHQLAGVGVSDEELAVIQAERDDIVDDRQQQRAVGAGTDGYPLVGDGRVTRAYRVDGNEAAAIALELADGYLERIGMMVLGGADHHEQFGAVQIGPAELPE